VSTRPPPPPCRWISRTTAAHEFGGPRRRLRQVGALALLSLIGFPRIGGCDRASGGGKGLESGEQRKGFRDSSVKGSEGKSNGVREWRQFGKRSGTINLIPIPFFSFFNFFFKKKVIVSGGSPVGDPRHDPFN